MKAFNFDTACIGDQVIDTRGDTNRIGEVISLNMRGDYPVAVIFRGGNYSFIERYTEQGQWMGCRNNVLFQPPVMVTKIMATLMDQSRNVYAKLFDDTQHMDEYITCTKATIIDWVNVTFEE